MTLIVTEYGRDVLGLSGEALVQFIAKELFRGDRDEARQYIAISDGDPRGECVRDEDWHHRFVRYLRDQGHSVDDMAREVQPELRGERRSGP